jgi:hypothetical protein
MVPYETGVDPRQVAAAKEHGAVVWTVEGHPLSVSSLLGLDTPVQGVMLNRMSAGLIDSLNGLVKAVTKPLEATPPAPAPWHPRRRRRRRPAAESTDSAGPNTATDEPLRKSAVGGAEDETTSTPGG